jgi:hypothetical protein
MPRGQRDGSLRPYSRFSRPEPLLFLSSSSSVVLSELSGPQDELCHDKHTAFKKGLVQPFKTCWGGGGDTQTQTYRPAYAETEM